MTRTALTVLLVVFCVTPSMCWNLPKPLAEFMDRAQARTRRNIVFVRPKVLAVTPQSYQPKVNDFFDWLLGIKAEPHSPRTIDSGEQLAEKSSVPTTSPDAQSQSPPKARLDAEEVKKRVAADLDSIMGEFKLKHPLDDIVGISKTVTGDRGMVKWYGSVQRTNGKTKFEPFDETQLKAEVGFEFNLNVTYDYHLRSTISRDGQTVTLIRHQRATFTATIVLPYSFYECYIIDVQVDYPKVTGEVDVQINAPSKFSMLGYQGGAISGRLFPQCHTDIADGIKKQLPAAAAHRMGKYFKEMLGSKVC